MKLEELAGRVYLLDAVDWGVRPMKRYYDGNETYDTNYIRFRLDGVVYEAYEDDNDGYRSCMADLLVTQEPMNNVFPSAVVQADMAPEKDTYGAQDYLLDVRDLLTGELVLQVGTHNTDDYYPSFISNWNPKGLAINRYKV